MSNSPWVTETSAATFEVDVIERSKGVPVVLDFWAAWCGPCRKLGPMLEKMTAEFAGQIALVKADVDQTPEQAQAFRVESIPAVYAVRNGQVVDSFVGLLTEPQLRQWMESLLPTETDLLVQQAEACEGTDPAIAESLFQKALDKEEDLIAAAIGVARTQLAQEKLTEAEQTLAKLQERGYLEPEGEKLLAELHLRRSRLSGGDLSALQQKVKEAPNDLPMRLQLAEALLAGGQYEEGLNECLTVVEAGPGPSRDRGRELMVSTFKIMGENSPLTNSFRRSLSLALC
ncbi:Thioredoxin [Anatilimnocola aggregata]|uniref:Thioredoxin n=1 Tax=Anatilimnocola aggregata TaxID=2528021 RepID=A0A517YHM8_9BACT|nr:tetratricopeptide repeat protein [Anatilimnocola aggregata]QDU29705.1 Thioredoxin [Anatilimnocola aggregata]